MLQMEETGLLNHLRDKWEPKDTCAFTRETQVQAIGISLIDLHMLFIFLFLGLFLATCVFALERFICQLLKLLKNKRDIAMLTRPKE